MASQALESTAGSEMDRNDSSSSIETESHDAPKPRRSCFQWLVFKLKLVEEDATPPNWKYISLVFAALFSSCTNLTFLFPFIPEMILFLGYDETEKGMYGGIIASALFAGRIFGSTFWGMLADRKGRKIVLLITLALNGVFSGLFGFSVNIYLAVFFRFMSGLVNGTVGTAKAILYDVSDNTNQAISMTMLSLAWGSGLVSGPLVGGILASPASKWPHVFDKRGLFGQYPFLLPSLFPVVVCLLVFFIIFFFFDETLVSKRENQDKDITGVEKGVTDNPDVRQDNNTLLQEPHQSARHLAGSVVSLTPEAEMSIILGKEAIKQESNLELVDIHCLTKSEPNLIYKPSGKHNALHLDNLGATSRPQQVAAIVWQPINGNVAQENGQAPDLHEQSSPLLSSKGDDPNGNPALYQRSISYNPKFPSDLVLAKDRKEKQNSLTNFPLEDNEVVVNSESMFQSKEEDICDCCDWCCRQSCCGPCTNSGLHKLLRLSDVWASIMLYSVSSFVTIAIDDIFPVFVSTDPGYGGLGFSSDEIGVALGATTLPLLFLQVKLYPFLVKRFGVRKTFILCAFVCLISAQLLPLIRLLNSSVGWLWTCMMIVQIPLKIGTNCCFASTALLINNSVTQDLAGQANGLAMTCTAIGRTCAPLVAGALFSWSVSFGPRIGPPFDISFPFFAIGFVYFVTCVECLFIKPSLDKQKK